MGPKYLVQNTLLHPPKQIVRDFFLEKINSYNWHSYHPVCTHHIHTILKMFYHPISKLSFTPYNGHKISHLPWSPLHCTEQDSFNELYDSTLRQKLLLRKTVHKLLTAPDISSLVLHIVWAPTSPLLWRRLVVHPL